MLYNNIFKKLLDTGYYIGNFNDFWLDDNGITPEDWNWAINIYKNSSKNMEELYSYRHNYLQQLTMEYLKKEGYTGPIPTKEETEMDVQWSRRNIRKKFIDDARAGGANIRTTQQWARFCLSQGKNTRDNYHMLHIFNELVTNFCFKIYKHLEQNKDKIELSTQFSIYNTGDFSEVHYDGSSPGRQCVIILYFADQNTYNNSGGRLIISKNNKYRSEINNDPKFLDYLIETNDSDLDFVEPIYGNYAILDFTKHDLGHGIEIVKNDFVRYALQVFLSLPK